MLLTHPTSARFGSGNSGIKNSKMNSNGGCDCDAHDAAIDHLSALRPFEPVIHYIRHSLVPRCGGLAQAKSPVMQAAFATFSLELLAGRFHIRIARNCQRHEAREKKSKSDQDCVNADNC